MKNFNDIPLIKADKEINPEGLLARINNKFFNNNFILIAPLPPA